MKTCDSVRRKEVKSRRCAGMKRETLQEILHAENVKGILERL